MKKILGPISEWELVYKILPRQIYKRNDRNFDLNGWRRGILVKSIGVGKTMYHHPEDYLKWKWDK